MLSVEQRKSLGQQVIDIAHHYYAGLKRISVDEAKIEFENRIYMEDALANSALRMGEREVLAGMD